MTYAKKPIKIDHYETVKSRIKLVGIELEGGWKKLPKGITWVGDRPPQHNQIGRDGSLDPFRQRVDATEFPYVGELPSSPIAEADIEKWLRAHWPSIVGPECGLHVHISLLNPLIYMRLMDDEAYAATVIEYLKQWANREAIAKDDPIWDRLAGNSPYCQHTFCPDEQVKNVAKDYSKERLGHRYTAINFAYGRETGTIECRVLSMPEDVEVGIRGVKEFISITNRYLVATAKREKKLKLFTVVDSPNQHITISSTL